MIRECSALTWPGKIILFSKNVISTSCTHLNLFLSALNVVTRQREREKEGDGRIERHTKCGHT